MPHQNKFSLEKLFSSLASAPSTVNIVWICTVVKLFCFARLLCRQELVQCKKDTGICWVNVWENLPLLITLALLLSLFLTNQGAAETGAHSRGDRGG